MKDYTKTERLGVLLFDRAFAAFPFLEVSNLRSCLAFSCRKRPNCSKDLQIKDDPRDILLSAIDSAIINGDNSCS